MTRSTNELSSDPPSAFSKVSTLTLPWASSWPLSVVRWIVSSPDDQIPSVYHFVASDGPLARICTSIQVPDGVVAFQEATSWLNPKIHGVRTDSDVHVPRSSETVRPYGSA